MADTRETKRDIYPQQLRASEPVVPTSLFPVSEESVDGARALFYDSNDIEEMVRRIDSYFGEIDDQVLKRALRDLTGIRTGYSAMSEGDLEVSDMEVLRYNFGSSIAHASLVNEARAKQIPMPSLGLSIPNDYMQDIFHMKASDATNRTWEPVAALMPLVESLEIKDRVERFMQAEPHLGLFVRLFGNMPIIAYGIMDVHGLYKLNRPQGPIQVTQGSTV